MSTWQPIETAPRDGTSVIVYKRGWCPQTENVDFASFILGMWQTEEGMRSIAPTHWMPLPDPPQE